MLDRTEEFKAAYLKYEKLVKKIAFRHVHDYYTAQDICQETFFRLHYYFDDMPTEKIKNFLVLVSRNLAKDVLKKGGKYTEVVGLPLVEEERLLIDELELSLDHMEHHAFLIEILEKLREKNAKWYEVLIMVDGLDIPRKKIAQEYGIALTTVDGYLKKAKNWLKKHYGDRYESL